MSSNTSAETPEEGKHTPGPWEQVIDTYTIHEVWKCVLAGKTIVATVQGTTRQEAEANAELIARAPSLERENAELKAKLIDQKALLNSYEMDVGRLKVERAAQAETIKRYKEALEELIPILESFRYKGAVSDPLIDGPLKRAKSALSGTNE